MYIFISMTREELLEHNIYCPTKIDDSIHAYLNLDFDILVSIDFTQLGYIPILIRNLSCPYPCERRYVISPVSDMVLDALIINNRTFKHLGFDGNKILSVISSDFIKWTH